MHPKTIDQMIGNAKIETCNQVINAMLLRVSMVALYVAAYRSLPTIKYNVSWLFKNPLIFIQFYETVSKKKILLDAYLRSFLIILLCIIVLLPIFKTLTAEIATDTIWFNFLICQVIYCIGSVKASIIAGKCSRPDYGRRCVIPLDESLLISKNIKSSNEVSSIAAVIGFILIFSRIRNNFDIVYLQTIGFILYFFLPYVLEAKRVCLNTCQTAAFVLFTILVSFWCDRFVCSILVATLLVMYSVLMGIVKLIK